MDASLSESIRVDDFCHKNAIAFVRGEVRGVFAQVFSDFGPSFTVTDINGGFSLVLLTLAPCPQQILRLQSKPKPYCTAS